MCVEDRAAFLLPEAGQDKTCQNAALKTVQRLGPSDKNCSEVRPLAELPKFALCANYGTARTMGRCARTIKCSKGDFAVRVFAAMIRVVMQQPSVRFLYVPL